MNSNLFSVAGGFSLGAAVAISLAAALPAAAIVAPATQTAVSFTSSTLFQDQPSYQFSLGYTFTTGANPLSVTALGYLNDGGAGSNAIHQIQIYKLTGGTVTAPTSGTALLGTPLSVTTVGSSPTHNTFTFAPVTAPLTLLANTPYEIVAESNGNPYGINAVGTVFSGIAYGTTVYGLPDTTPVFDNQTYAPNNVGDFGPNLQFTAAAVPEASTTVSLGVLLMLGLGSAIAVSRKKKISQS